MMTVHEVSRRTGVSVRTLQYYDNIGLLHPATYTQAGYRLYDDTALEKLQQILLFRELEFPLKEIRNILDSPSFDRDKALEQQITLLTMKKEHLEALIELAWNIKLKGEKDMDFSAFDTKKMEEYANFGLDFIEEKLEADPNCFFNDKAFLRVFMSFISPDTSDSGFVDDEPDEL